MPWTSTTAGRSLALALWLRIRLPSTPYSGLSEVCTNEAAAPLANKAQEGLGGPGSSSLGPSLCPYSPECVEGEFCELRHNGVLRSSAIIQNQGVGKGPVQVRPFLRLTPRRVFLSAFGRIAPLQGKSADSR